MKMKYRKLYPNVDIPDSILEELIKIDYHEQYVMRKDPLGKAYLYGSEEQLYRKKIIRFFSYEDDYLKPKINCSFLSDALDELKTIDLIGYKLIMDYYSNDPKSTSYLADMLGVTKRKVYQIREIALSRLRVLAIGFKNNTIKVSRLVYD